MKREFYGTVYQRFIRARQGIYDLVLPFSSDSDIRFAAWAYHVALYDVALQALKLPFKASGVGIARYTAYAAGICDILSAGYVIRIPLARDEYRLGVV